MNEQPERESDAEPIDEKRGGRNLQRLFWLTTLVTVVIVAASLTLYYASGTHLLDLSRPRATDPGILGGETWSFPAEGGLSEEDLQEFISEFSGMRGRINDANAFTDDELSNRALGLE